MSEEKKKPSRADRLRVAVEAIGTQVHTAGLVGVSPRQFRKYLAGEVDPPTEVLSKVSEASGYNLEWLIAGTGPPRSLVDAAIPVPGNIQAVLELRRRLHAELSTVYSGCSWPLDSASDADEFLLIDSTQAVSSLPVDLWDRGIAIVVSAHRAAMGRMLRKPSR